MYNNVSYCFGIKSRSLKVLEYRDLRDAVSALSAASRLARSAAASAINVSIKDCTLLHKILPQCYFKIHFHKNQSRFTWIVQKYILYQI
jgi:hypothetical protein